MYSGHGLCRRSGSFKIQCFFPKVILLINVAILCLLHPIDFFIHLQSCDVLDCHVDDTSVFAQISGNGNKVFSKITQCPWLKHSMHMEHQNAGSSLLQCCLLPLQSPTLTGLLSFRCTFETSFANCFCNASLLPTVTCTYS